MMNVVQANGGIVWFLNDPIEDNPTTPGTTTGPTGKAPSPPRSSGRRSGDTRSCPGPNGSSAAATRLSTARFGSEANGQGIDPACIRHRGDDCHHRPQRYGPEGVSWDCGTRGIGVVVSDSMMFQRGEPNPSDQDLGSFYGLAMPLVKHGIPAEPVQLENATPPVR